MRTNYNNQIKKAQLISWIQIEIHLTKTQSGPGLILVQQKDTTYMLLEYYQQLLRASSMLKLITNTKDHAFKTKLSISTHSTFNGL